MNSRNYPRSVTCAWCLNSYRSACPDDLDRGLQGSHCASDVVLQDGDWIVRGGYGSDEHDMHRYRFVANAPSVPADPICDECISERLRAGDLQDLGLECERRPADFGPRPFGTERLVHQIRGLVERMTAMQPLVDAVCREHAEHDVTVCREPTEHDKASTRHDETACREPTAHDKATTVHDKAATCAVCAEIRVYRKHQRWYGELEDGGEEHAEGCAKVAEQLRATARHLEKAATFWERSLPKEQP